MSLLLRLTLWQRISALATVLLLSPAVLVPSAKAQSSLQPPRSGICTGAELLQSDNIDVRLLKSILDRYNISIAGADEIGGRPLMRYEFTAALHAVLVQIGQALATGSPSPSQQDLATLKQLQERYIADLVRISGGMDAYGSYFRMNAPAADVEALRALTQRYRLKPHIPLRLGENRVFSRDEFATQLNIVLDIVNEQIQANGSNLITKTDFAFLKRLLADYEPELANLGGLIRTLEIRTSSLEAQQFSTTTKLSGITLFQPPKGGQVPIRNSTRLSLEQSFPGRDRLQSRLQPAPGTGNTEGYNLIPENPFFRPSTDPLSTFSIDVDTASYSNIRRFINQQQRPPKDAVRIEEMINYFSYNYPQPNGERPFSISTEVATAPWNPKHKLVQIGLKGKQLQTLQPSNLVFLVDVSGSMNSPNKLPLVKQSLCLLVNELTAQDRVTLVVYAGSAGLVLPPTSGNDKDTIMAAIDRLEAGGSTAGGAGIELAYKLAQQSFLPSGNNRVILATDGDFNVGVSRDAELVRLIEQKRDRGVFLTILGYGTGNYKDSKMEQLANKGNGNYAYIDTLLEARKVLVQDLRATLFTIAKDVKIQVEFNPAKVQAYRLIGYENRVLAAQDFNDDRKDAGEIGAGHTVTALYEIIPTGVESDVKLPAIDPLKYQQQNTASASNGNELMQVKLRYKPPQADTSQLISQPILDQNAETMSDNLRFASAVAMFGMLLRDSELKGQSTFETVLQLARTAKGRNFDGYRAEFLQLVERSQALVAQQEQDDQVSRDRAPAKP